MTHQDPVREALEALVGTVERYDWDTLSDASRTSVQYARTALASTQVAEASMPIMGTDLRVPFSKLSETQAQINHRQSLKTLASRGGLSACEAIALHECRAWHEMDRAVKQRQIEALAHPTLQAGEAEPVQIGWVVEHGAVSLPHGNPSRITVKTFFESPTEASKAYADAKKEFDCIFYPVWTVALASQVAPHQALQEAGGWSQAAVDVLAERQRQVSSEGWTPAHDDDHDDGVMAQAASCYAHAAHWNLMVPREAFTADDRPPGWPEEWNFKPAEPRRMLVKAGALILAEIERLDRASPTNEKGKI